MSGSPLPERYFGLLVDCEIRCVILESLFVGRDSIADSSYGGLLRIGRFYKETASIFIICSHSVDNHYLCIFAV